MLFPAICNLLVNVLPLEKKIVIIVIFLSRNSTHFKAQTFDPKIRRVCQTTK